MEKRTSFRLVTSAAAFACLRAASAVITALTVVLCCFGCNNLSRCGNEKNFNATATDVAEFTYKEKDGVASYTYSRLFTDICSSATVVSYGRVKVNSAWDDQVSITIGSVVESETTLYTLVQSGGGANLTSFSGNLEIDLEPYYKFDPGMFQQYAIISFNTYGTEADDNAHFSTDLHPTVDFSNVGYAPRAQ